MHEAQTMIKFSFYIEKKSNIFFIREFINKIKLSFKYIMYNIRYTGYVIINFYDFRFNIVKNEPTIYQQRRI